MKPRTTFVIASLLLGGCAASPAARQATTPATQRPASSAELYERGLALAARGDTVRAEQYLALALEAGHPAAQTRLAMIEVCVAGSRLRGALEHARRYLTERPADWRVRLVVAALLRALGRDQAALRQLDQLAQQDDAGPEVHYHRAVLLRDRFEDLAGARAGFHAYVATAPHGEHVPEARAWLAYQPSTDGDAP
jgi:predicted Zn-dependent protease